jgi:hypothetical protein
VPPKLFHLLAAIAAPAALLTAPFGEAPSDVSAAPIMVFLADGTSLPLRGWALSYEYAAWRREDGPARGSTDRRESQELWSGKRTVSTAGLALEVQYESLAREEEVNGETKTVMVPVARGFALVAADGKRSTLKPDPPAADLLLSESGGRVVQPRAVDLVGETLTGTRREFCLLSYSALVECPADPAQRVLRIEFPR